jgi:hypothetical protein
MFNCPEAGFWPPWGGRTSPIISELPVTRDQYGSTAAIHGIPSRKRRWLQLLFCDGTLNSLDEAESLSVWGVPARRFEADESQNQLEKRHIEALE